LGKSTPRSRNISLRGTNKTVGKLKENWHLTQDKDIDLPHADLWEKYLKMKNELLSKK
jgi:hypothetical protein